MKERGTNISPVTYAWLLNPGHTFPHYRHSFYLLLTSSSTRGTKEVEKRILVMIGQEGRVRRETRKKTRVSSHSY